MSDKQSTNQPAPQKKQYHAPVLERVALRAEEAVLGFCKNNTGTGPRGGACRNVSKCATQGS